MKLTNDILTEEALCNFGNTLHWLRAENNLSLQQAAQHLEWSPQALEELEIGRAREIDCQLLRKLCSLFNTRVELTWRDDDD